jgi:phage gp36-like protein
MAVIRENNILVYDLPQCRKLSYAPAPYHTGNNPIYQQSNTILSALTNFQSGVDGYNDGRYVFTGTNRYIQYYQATPLLNGVSQFSIEMWVNPTATNVAEQWVVKRSSDISKIHIQSYTDNKLYFQVCNGSIAQITINNYSDYITAGVLNCVTFTFNGGNAAADRLKVYVNGIAVPSGSLTITGTFPTTTPTNANQLLFGTTATSYKGTLESFKIWDVELTPTEVLESYNQGVTMFGSKLNSSGVLTIKPNITSITAIGHTLTIAGTNFVPWSDSTKPAVTENATSKILRSYSDSQIVLTGYLGVNSYTVTNSDTLSDSDIFEVIASTKTLTIKHIGDSISKLGVYANINSWLSANYPNIDYVVDNINNGGVATNWLGNYFDWFDPYEADILICNAGMHDRDDDPDDYSYKLECVLRNYKAKNPNLTVVWASTTLTSAAESDPENVMIIGNNSRAVTVLNSVFGVGNWFLVDQYTFQDENNIPFSDSVHPTTAGYLLYADNWETHLAPVIDAYVDAPVAEIPKLAFGICPNGPSDFKTGSPTMSIVDGVATFSVAQTHDLMGVGAEITYNTTEKAYIRPAGKVSTSQWVVSTKNGGVPANVTDAVVNSIAHPFGSMMAAVNGFGGVNYLETYDLRNDTGANVELHLCGYKEQATFTDDTTRVNYIDKPKGDTTHRLFLRSPTSTANECNLAMGSEIPSRYDSTKYLLVSSAEVLYKYNTSSWLYIKHLQIKQYFSATAGISRVISLVPVDIEALDIENCVLITATTGGSSTAIQDGIFIGTVFNPKANIHHNLFIALDNTGTNNGSALQLNCNATINFHNNTIVGKFLRAIRKNVTGGAIVSRSNVFLKMPEWNGGVGTIDNDYDVYDLDIGETNGTLTTQADEQIFADASGGTYDLWDFTPVDGSDLIGNGVGGIDVGAVDYVPPPTNTITVTVGPNGTISPNGSISVIVGDDLVLMVTPANGYSVGTITVSAGLTYNIIGDQLTISGITENGAVSVTFAVNTFNVTYNGNGSTGGNAPTDSNDYEAGDSVTVANAGTLTRTGYTATGYNTAANGTGTSRAFGSTFSMPSANVTLFIQWTPISSTYDVTVQSSGNSTVSPSGVNTVNSGENLSVLNTPDAGFQHATWTATGGLTIENPALASTRILNVTGAGTVTASVVVLDVYSTISDLKKYMEPEIIRQLTDDNNTGEIDTKIVYDCINQADNLIDSFLRGRYPADMDFADVPGLISDISTKLAAYNLYRRKMQLTLPETISKDYKFCVDMLRDIQSGKVSPFPILSEPTIILTNKKAADKQYSPTLWGTY